MSMRSEGEAIRSARVGFGFKSRQAAFLRPYRGILREMLDPPPMPSQKLPASTARPGRIPACAVLQFWDS
jgi:hypothetical protein